MAASSVNSLDSSPTYSGALSHVKPAGMLPLQDALSLVKGRRTALRDSKQFLPATTRHATANRVHAGLAAGVTLVELGHHATRDR